MKGAISGHKKVEAVHITRHPIVKSACQLDKAQFLLAFPSDQSYAFAEAAQTEFANSAMKTADKHGVSRRNNFIREDPGEQTDKSLGRMEG
jgi:hypothetical protein